MEQIDFVGYDADVMLQDMINAFEEGTKDDKGNIISLNDGDERVVLLNCMNYLGECMANHINKLANNNFATLCDEASLIYKGFDWNITRLPAEPATVSMRFTANSLAPIPVTVPAGTKVTADGEIFFTTTEPVTIPAGQSADIICAATSASAAANGYGIGIINKLVDTIPFIDSVSNTDVSAGGADEESLDAFRDRVVFAPLAFVPGTEIGYMMAAKGVSSAIRSTACTGVDNNISVYILCNDGELPGTELLAEVQAYMDKPYVKRICDKITVKAAEQVDYAVDMSFKILSADKAKESEIRERVEAAVNEYIESIGTVMGGNINPEMLRKAAYVAGAASVEITSPAYIPLEKYQVAHNLSCIVNYSGTL